MVKLLSITIKESLTTCIHFSTPGRWSMLNYSAKLCANSVVPSFCKAGQLQQQHVGELSMEAPLSPFNLVKVYLEKSDMFPQISILELIAQAIMWVQFIGIENLFGQYSFHLQMSNCPKISTTPITAMGCWQCLSLSVVQLKGKHC